MSPKKSTGMESGMHELFARLECPSVSEMVDRLTVPRIKESCAALGMRFQKDRDMTKMDFITVLADKWGTVKQHYKLKQDGALPTDSKKFAVLNPETASMQAVVKTVVGGVQSTKSYDGKGVFVKTYDNKYVPLNVKAGDVINICGSPSVLMTSMRMPGHFRSLS